MSVRGAPPRRAPPSTMRARRTLASTGNGHADGGNARFRSAWGARPKPRQAQMAAVAASLAGDRRKTGPQGMGIGGRPQRPATATTPTSVPGSPAAPPSNTSASAPAPASAHARSRGPGANASSEGGRMRRISAPTPACDDDEKGVDNDALRRARAVLQRARLHHGREDIMSLGVSVWTGYTNVFAVVDCRADEPVDVVLQRAVEETVKKGGVGGNGNVQVLSRVGKLRLLTQGEFDRKCPNRVKRPLVERTYKQCLRSMGGWGNGQRRPSYSNSFSSAQQQENLQTLRQLGLKDGDALHVQGSTGWQCWQ